MKRNPIYVEIPIKSEIESVWQATQDPKMHEQWDLRFSSITYLPKQDQEIQRFNYERKIAFGLKVAGWGKSIGTHHAQDGTKSSSLHFGTEQKMSPIKEGRGYWKYVPRDGHVQFLTQYDYDVNFGKLGAVIDRLVFRPIMGWGTALSFDVLKRWLEKGEAPASQYLRFFSNWLIVFLFFFIWVYHGLVPKILFTNPEEIYMLQRFLPFSHQVAYWLTVLIGIGEILFGTALLLFRNKRPLFLIQMLAFPFLATSALIAIPDYLAHPFSPITFHSAMITLSLIAFWMNKDLPSAKSCKRKK